MEKFFAFLNRQADQAVDGYGYGENRDGGATLLLLILFMLFLPFYLYWRLFKLPWRTGIVIGVLLGLGGLALREILERETAQLLALAFGVLGGVVLLVLNVLRGLAPRIAGTNRRL